MDQQTNITRRATARWKGPGLDGAGTIATTSGALDALPYSHRTRFRNEDGRLGSNPEELVAAAHAACFNMALSFRLGGAGFTAEDLQTEATLEMHMLDDYTITRVTLRLEGRVPGISEEQFLRLAEEAKATCPVSRVLNAEVILQARLT